MYLEERRPESVNRREIEHVSAWLEREAQSTRARHRIDALHEMLLLAGMAGVAWAMAQPVMAAIAATAACTVVVVALLSARRRTGAHAARVIAAVRDRPGIIRTIRYRKTRTYRWILFGLLGPRPRHSLEVTTDDGLLVIDTPRWRTLLDALARRCPHAMVEQAAW